jgi:hypothetical protein
MIAPRAPSEAGVQGPSGGGGADSILKSRFSLRERAAWLLFRVQVHTRVRFARAAVARLLARALPRADGRAVERQPPAARQLAGDLDRQGYVHLPPLLTSEQIDDVIRFVDDQPCFDPYQPDLARFKCTDPPEPADVGHYSPAVVLRAPHLLGVANAPAVVSVAAEYLGCKPTISNVSLWWSFPHARPARNTQLFHRDRDDWKFCKLFVHLTAVDEESGPHVFVEGSHRSVRPSSLRRYTDEEVLAYFPRSSIKAFCLPAGSGFLVDTFGVHKGLAPTGRRRLLFQVEYSLLPIYQYQYAPLALPDAAQELLSGLDPYVNRLLIQSPPPG